MSKTEQGDGPAIDDDTLKEITTWPAALNDDQMRQIESEAHNSAQGQHRRFLLAVLTKDSEALFQACESEPEAFFDGFKKSAPTVANYKCLTHMLAAAHNRLMIALCSIDFSDPDTPFSMQEFQEAVRVAAARDLESGGAV